MVNKTAGFALVVWPDSCLLPEVGGHVRFAVKLMARLHPAAAEVVSVERHSADLIGVLLT